MLDNAWEPVNDLRSRLTEEAYLWEPVANCWTVRSTDNGWFADWDDSDPQPAPVTTIAWRMWHIAVDCLDSYSSRFGVARGTGFEGPKWLGTASEALDMMYQAWTVFHGIATSWDDAALMTPLGPTWGPYGAQPQLDITIHATREVVHHLAEISLLIDLHSARV